MKSIQKTSFLILIALLGLALAAGPALAQCGDSERQAFADAVDAGVSYEDLEAAFGHCRDDVQGDPVDDIAPVDGFGVEKLISIIPTGSVFYEEMNGCGYNPQSKQLACDVEVKRTTWYGTFGPRPQGSDEFVRYCLACGTTSLTPAFFDHTFLSAVHVTNERPGGSGGLPPYFFTSTAQAWPDPPTTTCPNTDGAAFTVRAILSWAVPPPDCFSAPIWGNQITWTARRDP